VRLYSYWRSSAAYRVRIALALKGLAYEYVAVHLVRDGGEQRHPQYLAMNPGGRVPTVEVGGRFIFQSMAIMEWMDEAYPEPPLLPTEAVARAQARGIAQMIVADIQPLQNISVTNYLKSVHQFDEAQVAAWLRHWIRQGMTAVEQSLQATTSFDYACGDHPGLVDACLIPQCYAARRFGVDVERFPRIHAIERKCLDLPAFRLTAPECQPDVEGAAP